MRSLVDDVKNKLDIVDLISSYLKLTPAGANFRGLCPFHREKTPSFMVNRERQIFHCFGCGKGGDIITFVEEMEGLEFREAIKLLAEKANLDLKIYQSSGWKDQSGNEKEILRRILEASTIFFSEKIFQSEGQNALKYLLERGVNQENIKKFRLGYAPNHNKKGSPCALFDHLKKIGFDDKNILNSGSVYQKDNRSIFVDRFRDRIIFPIADSLGRIVGFSARVLPGADTFQGKYINTPQTLLYDKGGLLYGFHLAKKYIRERKEALLLEGNLDVVLSHQADVGQAVATCGTALGKKQLTFLRRYTDKLILAFDADMAGVKATKKGAEMAWEENFDVKVIPIEKGKDVADLVKENPRDWVNRSQKRKSLMGYFFNLAFKKRKLDLDQKKILTEKLLRLLVKIPSRVEQAHFLKKLSEEVAVQENFLWEKLNILQKDKRGENNYPQSGSRKDNFPSPNSSDKPTRHSLLEEKILGLILSFPQLYSRDQTKIEGILFSNPKLKNIWDKLLPLLQQNKPLKFKNRDLEMEIAQITMKLTADFKETGEEEIEKASSELKKCLQSHAKESLKVKRKEILKKINFLKGKKNKAISPLMKELEKISKEIVALKD